MRIVICDRCGKEMGDDDPGMVEVKISGYGLSSDEYDLCQSCKRKLQRWIENAEDNDKREAAGAE